MKRLPSLNELIRRTEKVIKKEEAIGKIYRYLHDGYYIEIHITKVGEEQNE